MDNGNARKLKAHITIFIDETDQFGYQTSTNNFVTFLGMLEMAKKCFIDQSHKPKEEPLIKMI